MTTKRQYSGRLRRRIALSAGGVLVILALVVGVALAASGPSSVPVAVTNVPVAPTASVDSADLAAFGILRRAQAVTDQVPQKEAMTFAGPSGANLELARRVQGLNTGSAWVFPGRGSVCLMANGAGSCIQDSAAAAGELIDLSGNAAEPGVELLSGMAPDGVSHVSVHLSSGATETLVVHDNVYTDSVHGTVTSVTLDGPSGSTTVTVQGPPPGVTP